MEHKVEGQLKEWLEQDGRHDLVDAGSVDVDPAELDVLEKECRRHHPHYPEAQVTAWAIFSIVTRKRLSADEQAQVGTDATKGVGRVASAVEGTTREFRALRGAFDQQHQKIDSVAKAIERVEAQVKTCGEETIVNERLSSSAICQHIDSFRTAWDDHNRSDATITSLLLHRESVRLRWMWAWRIAVLLALIGLLAVRGHAQSTAIIQGGNTVTVTAACISSHNCFDVDLLNIPHFICDSGCSGGGGGGGTSSTFGAAFPTTGTAIGVSNGTNMVALTLGQALAAASLPVILPSATITTLTPPTASAIGTAVAGALANPLPVSGTFFQSTQPISIASGGVASGAIASGAVASGAYASGSIADGAMVTIGAKADAKNAATDTTAVSVMAVLKEISSLEQAPASRPVTNVGTFATQSSITAASGSIASGAVASGAYASGSISDGAEVTIGAKADAKNAATDTTAVSAISILKEISSLEQAPVTRPVTNAGTFASQATLQAGSALAGEIVPVTTATTTDTALRCTLISAASTNSTNCKNGSGNVYGYRFVNTTATLYYLRMYNSSSAPTCSSATGFIETIPIPASATGAGIVSMEPFGEGYSTGIGFCFTGGSASTDNTNAATGVFGTILYK